MRFKKRLISLMFRCLVCLGCGMLLLPATIVAAESSDHQQTSGTPEAGGLQESKASQSGPEVGVNDASAVFGLGFLDRTQLVASNSANALAKQLDRFFGVERSDIEAAYSSLRLTATESWNEIDGFDSRLRLRGKVHLPRVNERLSLIFSDEDDTGTTDLDQTSTSVAQEESTRVNLEVNLAEEKAHRLFFRVGLRSGLKGRVSMRYRYEPVADNNTVNRFTQTLYFKDGDGFGTRSRYQLDHILGSESLIRWTNDLRFEESFVGGKYTSSLEFLQVHSNKTATSWYARINGLSSPGYVANYDLGYRLRKNIARRWLFLEIEPGYSWRKQDVDLDREGTPFVLLRLEMAIGKFN